MRVSALSYLKYSAEVVVFAWASTVSAQPAYDFSKMQTERLGRGLVAVSEGDSAVISWRSLKGDAADLAFEVWAHGKSLHTQPLTHSTFLKVPLKGLSAGTEIELRWDGGTASTRLLSTPYLSIPLKRPQGAVTPRGDYYEYTPNDCSVGDVDGDGEYEIVVKWSPTNAHDNSHSGYTGSEYFDCYRLDGTHLWRIDLGKNIRAGAHYSPFLVYDLDGDGRAELMVKTADGTRDGLGHCIGDSTANWVTSSSATDSFRPSPERRRGNQREGLILSGSEYLTVFSGLTGEALATVPYVPERGDCRDWGDDYGNRSERYLACVAYLDGVHPSAVMCRGYYTRTVLTAWDWDGQTLRQHWTFDSNTPELNDCAGQGNHNLRVADVDADGCDEITYGSMAIDHDGTLLYNTHMGHGDALHLMACYPDSTQLQVWDVHENRRDGSELRDARTGRVIFQIPSSKDVGRGMAADITAENAGVEMWSADSHGLRNVRGEVVDSIARIPMNSAVWWDGDRLRELLDHERIWKYMPAEHNCRVIEDFSGDCTFNNGSKSNPCLSADLLGDWREEVVVRTRTNDELRIYTTLLPTPHRITCLMQDIPYRLSVVTENVGYNQPPEVGFYLGEY